MKLDCVTFPSAIHGCFLQFRSFPNTLLLGSYADFFTPVQFSSVTQSRPTLCDPMDARPPLSITNSQSLLKLMSIKLVMPSCFHSVVVITFASQVGDTIQPSHPLSSPSPPSSVFPSIGVFSNESVLCIRWPKYWISHRHDQLLIPFPALLPFLENEGWKQKFQASNHGLTSRNSPRVSSKEQKMPLLFLSLRNLQGF